MLSWLIFAAVGRIVIFVWMKFSLPFKNEWLEKLHACDLCSGVWIYGILALAFGVDIFVEVFRTSFISQIVTGILTSYIVHYFVEGFVNCFTEWAIKEHAL